MDKKPLILQALQAMAAETDDGVIHTDEPRIRLAIGDQAKGWGIHEVMIEMNHAGHFKSFFPQSAYSDKLGQFGTFRVVLPG